MNALAFIITRSLKNTVLEVFRKPAKLIVWIVVAAILVGLFIMSVFVRSAPEQTFAELIWLKGFIFALFSIFVIISVQKGLSRGDMIFSMSDVNLLFVSPVDSRHILFYGIVQMAKMSMLAGFFLLFQGNSICSNFNVGYGSVLIIFLGFILALSLMQIVSLLIYSHTNGRPGRKRFVQIFTALVFVPLSAVYCVALINSGDVLTAIEAALRSPALSWIPAAGWAAEGTISFIAGDFDTGALFYGLILLGAAGLIFYIMRSNPDYYEDVLVASETAFEKKRAISKGQVSLEAVSDRKIKVVKTGIGGIGASSLFFKHLRESFRSARFGLWGIQSLLLVAGAIIFSFAAKNTGIILLLQILMWFQVFLIGTARGMKELLCHYIFMMPESPFSKALWSNAETMLKIIVESAFIFIVAGLIIGESAVVILLCAAVYTLFSLLLIGINYLSMRFAGMDISAGFTLVLYMIVTVIVMLPGLAAAIFCGTAVGGQWGLALGLLILAVWELIAACLIFAASKGILHNCDMPVVKIK